MAAKLQFFGRKYFESKYVISDEKILKIFNQKNQLF